MNNVKRPNESSRGFRSEKGNVLAFTLVLSILIFMIAIWSFRSVMSQQKMANSSYRLQQSLATAEAGIEMAIHEMNKSSRAPITVEVPQWTEWEQLDLEYIHENTLYGSGGAPIGEFKVSIMDPESATPTIESTGYIPNKLNPVAKRSLRVVAINNRERPRYIATIETLEDLHVSGGGDTCSFHSSEGAPGSSVNQNNTYGNVITHGDAYFDNGTDVFGSVEAEGEVYGPDGLVQGTNPDGEQNQVISNGDPPPVPDFPDDELNEARITNDNLTGITPPDGMALEDVYDPVTGALSVTGNNQTLTLAPGTYYFTSFDLTGNNSEIIVQPEGEVKIFLEAPDPNDTVFHLNNSASVNGGGLPPNMEFLVKSGNIWWENAGEVYSPVFAPFSDVVADNAFDMFGAIVCRNMDINGGGMFIYDEALGGSSSDAQGVRVTAWLEITPL